MVAQIRYPGHRGVSSPHLQVLILAAATEMMADKLVGVGENEWWSAHEAERGMARAGTPRSFQASMTVTC